MTKILIVEDEVIVAQHLKQRLELLGHETPILAYSGEEALQQAAEQPIDLVLMDIHLVTGEMDGIQTAEAIQTLYHLPVVYLTAFTDEATVQRAKRTEPFGYLLKPFNTSELKITIEMALYKHQMEQKLKRHERWLSTTLHSIGDAVIATDTNGCIVFMNPIAETLTGWPQTEALGKNLAEIFSVVDEQTGHSIDNPAIRAIQENQVVTLPLRTRLIGRNGQSLPIDDCTAPIKDENGRITGTVLVFRDVLKLREAEAERERLIGELQTALAKIKTLSGMIPICASCKKVRVDEDYWQQIEVYIRDHSEVEFTHGLCPDCLKNLYSEFLND